MFKVNNKDTRTTPSVSIFNFEHAIAGWVLSLFTYFDFERVLSHYITSYYSITPISFCYLNFKCFSSHGIIKMINILGQTLMKKICIYIYIYIYVYIYIYINDTSFRYLDIIELIDTSDKTTSQITSSCLTVCQGKFDDIWNL